MLSEYSSACIPADLPLFFQSVFAHGRDSGIFVFHMEGLVFSGTQIMKCQQLKRDLKAGGDLRCLFQVFFIIVEASFSLNIINMGKLLII